MTAPQPDLTTIREPAYEATRMIIRRFPPISTSGTRAAEENARVWRAMEAALDAMRVDELLAVVDRLTADLATMTEVAKSNKRVTQGYAQEVDRLTGERDEARDEVGSLDVTIVEMNKALTRVEADRDALREELAKAREALQAIADEIPVIDGLPDIEMVMKGVEYLHRVATEALPADSAAQPEEATT